MLQSGSDGGNLRCKLFRHGQHSVTIAMQEVAWTYFQSAHFHLRSKIEDVSVSVSNGDIPGKYRKARRANLWQLSNRAIGDKSDATQSAQDRGVHIAEECAETGRLIHILEHDDARRGNR